MTYEVNKQIKAITKTGKSIIDGYSWAKPCDSIFDIYNSFSSCKYIAFKNCMETYSKFGGVGGLRCCGSSSFAFSVTFKDNLGNFYKITKDNFYKVVA